MKPTRKTQPFRRGVRSPGGALTNAMRGRGLYGTNPMDLQRRTMRKRRRRRSVLARALTR